MVEKVQIETPEPVEPVVETPVETSATEYYMLAPLLLSK